MNIPVPDLFEDRFLKLKIFLWGCVHSSHRPTVTLPWIRFTLALHRHFEVGSLEINLWMTWNWVDFYLPDKLYEEWATAHGYESDDILYHLVPF